MSLRGFDKISTNADLLIHIYKLLDFDDQLSLSCVSDQLHSVFVNYVVKDAYNTLKVVRRVTNVLVTSGKQDNITFLEPKEFKYFLKCYAKYVQELNVSRSLTNHNGGYTTPFSMLIERQQFQNLTSLRLKNAVIRRQHLDVIARSCPKLQTLCLSDCSSTNAAKRAHHNNPSTLCEDTLIVNDSENVSSLMTINNLKRLTIEHSCSTLPQLDYNRFLQLVYNLDLECLNLQAVVQPDRFFKKSNPAHLKELTITISFDNRYCAIVFRSFLANFTNLTMLSLALTDIATDGILAVLSETCLELETLHFRHTRFDKVEAFLVPPKLKELALEHCSGLNITNLREIISHLKITKFTSKVTRYSEQFTNCALIETFLIDNYYRPHDAIYIGNPSLKELTWREGDICYYEYDYRADLPWKICPNLRKLVLLGGFIPVQSLLYLYHLSNLHITMQNVTPQIEWSYITDILRHPSLNELTIDIICNNVSCHLRTTIAPARGTLTNVKRLTIPYVIFKPALNYWLDIFRRNRHMTLVCSHFCEHHNMFLKTLMRHHKFPNTINTIDVWGFIIRCQTLRDNFKATIDKLIYDCAQLYPDVNYKPRIIMRRNR